MKFFVSDVNCVISPVGQLKKSGHDVDFYGKPSIGVGQYRVALRNKRNLFELPVRLQANDGACLAASISLIKP